MKMPRRSSSRDPATWDAEACGKWPRSAIERRAAADGPAVIVLHRRGTEFARASSMRTLLVLPIVIVISACVADVEDEAPRDENAATEQPGDMPSYDEGDDPGDPCAIGLAFDPSGDLLSVPTECIAEPEVDDGDPPPDAEGMSEHSVLPH